MAAEKGKGILFLIILCSIIVGGFLGEFFRENSLLGFLAWGFPIGTTDDLGRIKSIEVNLKMLQMSFGLLIYINFASICTLLAGLYFYSKS